MKGKTREKGAWYLSLVGARPLSHIVRNLKIKQIKGKIFDIIESPDDRDAASRAFDTSILLLIIVNLILIIAETFPMSQRLHDVFNAVEIFTVIVFTLEYALRLWTADLMFPALSPAKARVRFLFTFMALIDLFSILPFYIPFVFSPDFLVLRALRIIRLLRLFKINRVTSTFSTIGEVFRKKFRQLASSIFIIFLLMLIVSVLMFNVEHDAQPEKFHNAFSSFWWALSTLTTIGYGDIYPITVAGQILNGVFAFLGIGLIAIPTGIISAGFVEQARRQTDDGDGQDEKCFCPYCGKKLD